MKRIILLILFFVSLKCFGQYPLQQSIGNSKAQVNAKGGIATDSSFAFITSFADTTSANRGFLDGIAGNVIRVNDTLYIRNGHATAWVQIGGGNNWRLTGNSGTTVVSNFLGTTDNQDVVIKANSIERLRAETSGGISVDQSISFYTSGNLNRIEPISSGKSLNLSGTDDNYGVAFNANHLNSQIGTVRVGGDATGQAFLGWFPGSAGQDRGVIGISGSDNDFYIKTVNDTGFVSIKAFPPAAVRIDSSRFAEAYGTPTAASNNLILPYNGNTFPITGNTQINAITTYAWQAGTVIRLIFSGTPTVKDNTVGGAGTAPIQLSGSADFTATAGDILQLLYDGTDWKEIGRVLGGTVTGSNIYNSDGTLTGTRTLTGGGNALILSSLGGFRASNIDGKFLEAGVEAPGVVNIGDIDGASGFGLSYVEFANGESILYTNSQNAQEWSSNRIRLLPPLGDLEIDSLNSTVDTSAYKPMVWNPSTGDVRRFNSWGETGLGGGMAIGGTVTSGTAGSVLFIQPSNTLAQDNSNFFWDDTNNRLGIGTAASPQGRLHINSTTGNGALFQSSDGVMNFLVANDASPTTGDNYLASLYSSNFVLLQASHGGGGNFAIRNISGPLYLQSAAANSVILYPAATQILTATSTGVGIGTSVTSPATLLHTSGTVRHASLGSAITDTATYKPLVIDATGNLRPSTYWYGSGGGGLDTIVVANVGAGINTGYGSNDTIFFKRLRGDWITVATQSDSSILLTGQNIYNYSGILTANRTVTGLDQTYGLLFDSLAYFEIDRANILRFMINAVTSAFYSPNGTNYVSAANDSVQLFGPTSVVGNARFTGQISSTNYGIADATTITWNWNAGTNVSVTLGGNRTLSITNPVAGTYGTLVITQDGTGSRTITLPGTCKVVNGGAGAVTLSTAAGAIDVLSFYYNGTNFFVSYGKNFN